MKQFFLGALLLAVGFVASPVQAEDGLKVAVVNFRQCAEQSQLGKQEQQNFEGLKQQLQTSISAKEKELTKLSEQFNDADYLDSLSPEAEQELRAKVRQLSQEYQQIQQQLYQTLNQVNHAFVQKLGAAVTEASQNIAKKKGFNLVVNAEGAFYFSEALDLTEDVVAEMDRRFEEQKDETTNGS